MAGKGTISVNQTPQYGDKTKLASLNKNLTKTPTTGVPTPTEGAGRPVSTGAGSQPTAPPASEPVVPGQHQSMMTELAEAYRTHQFWQGVLQQYPSEWSRVYAKEAERIFQQKQIETRNSTPFFS
jgi:hypothetical protein